MKVKKVVGKALLGAAVLESSHVVIWECEVNDEERVPIELIHLVSLPE
jgi:hypothetical protein